MKVLLCTTCVDIRALDPDGKPTACRCGKVTAWWTDPAKGTAKVYAKEREVAWMIGLHNGFLLGAVASAGMRTPGHWQALHDYVCDAATGYIFHRDQRACWAAPFQPGWTDDVTWATEEEMGKQEASVNRERIAEAGQRLNSCLEDAR